MPEIIDLEMSDEEYLDQIAEGRDPVLEKLYERQLARLQSQRRAAAKPSPLQPLTHRSNRWAFLGASFLSLLGFLVCLLVGQSLLGASRSPGLDSSKSQSNFLLQCYQTKGRAYLECSDRRD
uniref:Uncharacterized protein n=1 Tax=Cyanothece sp. (strain PCC 7425 / ATCC 29141) TaxID=395961 RepID=B8HLP4_CYAP4